jgi:hypothetical protein
VRADVIQSCGNFSRPSRSILSITHKVLVRSHSSTSIADKTGPHATIAQPNDKIMHGHDRQQDNLDISLVAAFAKNVDIKLEKCAKPAFLRPLITKISAILNHCIDFFIALIFSPTIRAITGVISGGKATYHPPLSTKVNKWPMISSPDFAVSSSMDSSTGEPSSSNPTERAVFAQLRICNSTLSDYPDKNHENQAMADRCTSLTHTRISPMISSQKCSKSK